MRSFRQPACTRPDLAAVLPHWDQLPDAEQAELVEHAAGCELCGPSLQLLHGADAWLARWVPASPARAGSRRRARAAASSCPPADLLYDYGGGPGSVPIGPLRRAEVEAHLTDCADCTELVATLDVAPPQPLLESLGEVEPRRTGAPLLRLQRFLPLAAAALLAVTALLFGPDWRSSASAHLAPRFPAAPVMRGLGTSPLRFPQGPVLAFEDAAGRLGTVTPLRFELAAGNEGAEAYRLTLSRHDGSAFSRGTEIHTFEAVGPVHETDLSLAPGHYTWEAWATVNGLERRLGARDFQVVEDSELLAELRGLDRVEDEHRLERGIALLHERGFLTDARRLAQQLPASPERDTYLAEFPTR